jgi:hypothetical protein
MDFLLNSAFSVAEHSIIKREAEEEVSNNILISVILIEPWL